MPFLCMKTNAKNHSGLEKKLKSAFGEKIALIEGKSEKWLMTEILWDRRLWFRGSSDPCAILLLFVFGRNGSYQSLSMALTELLSKELQIPQSRIYIGIYETDQWAWDGKMLS